MNGEHVDNCICKPRRMQPDLLEAWPSSWSSMSSRRESWPFLHRFPERGDASSSTDGLEWGQLSRPAGRVWCGHVPGLDRQRTSIMG